MEDNIITVEARKMKMIPLDELVKGKEVNDKKE